MIDKYTFWGMITGVLVSFVVLIIECSRHEVELFKLNSRISDLNSRISSLEQRIGNLIKDQNQDLSRIDEMEERIGVSECLLSSIEYKIQPLSSIECKIQSLERNLRFIEDERRKKR